MTPKKKIVFVLPDLVAGGAERVMSFIANNISKDDFETSLWLAGFEKNSAYKVDTIDVKYFNKSRVLNAMPNFFWALQKEKPDLVISSLTHVNTAMALLSIFFPKIKFIGRETIVHNVFTDEKRTIRLGGFIPMNFSYRLLDMIICQSKDMYHDMKLNHGVPESKLQVINNPITDNFQYINRPINKKDYFQFITVGRLSKQKGHNRIINVLSKLNVPFVYTIIGDGPEKDGIFKLIEELGLNKKIIHIPYTNKVSEYLLQSDLFLQGSYFEGFPNCLLESSAMGTPIVGFQAPGGIDEIIQDGINGFIAQNEEEFEHYILKSINGHPWDSNNINENIIKKYNKEKILHEYETMFSSILNKK